MPEKPQKGADAESALSLPEQTPRRPTTLLREKVWRVKGKKYLVTLRFRGVVEPMMYKTADGRRPVLHRR